MNLNPTPRFFWLLVLGTLASLLGFGLLAWRLSQGVANPPHAGSLQWADEEFLWAGGSGEQLIPANETVFFAAPHPLNYSAFTLEISAQLSQTTDPVAAWGIGLANLDGTWMMIGINGAGYVTARQCPMENIPHLDDCAPLTEPTQHILTYWKPFRFIHLRGAGNTIRVDFSPTQNRLTLRLNQEWMWDLPYTPTGGAVNWGVWIENGPNLPSGLPWGKTQVWSDK
ncbi:MAG: hypothetical protein HY862_13395 [Chloroflexi bacterium]|nr:hypothetical protein [Chloroflexota bacterium]